MDNRRFTKLLIPCMIIFMSVMSSCQKDSAGATPETEKTNLIGDSTDVSAIVSSPGNYLASSGKLQLKINDSTYTFDASRDSIAFINVHISDKTRYFGITAINKEHTMSFGISASGFINSNINGDIAGSQFIVSPGQNKPFNQYSLSKFTGQQDSGSISIEKYNQGNVLAKGTFFTFLAKDAKANTPFYRVEGSFDLQLK